MRRNSTIVWLILALLASAVSAPALAESESDGGYFDFFSDGGKIGNRFVDWIWEPHYFPGGIDYTVFILCFRQDQDGNLVGTNKVTIKNVTFVGLGSNIEVGLKKKSQKINKFHNNGYLTINAPELGLLANDDFVLAEALFQIKGSSGPDQIKCSIDVTEQPQALAAGAAKAKPAPSRSLVELLRSRPAGE